MAKERVIVGLDIGTCNIRTVVAKFRNDQEKPQIIGIGVAPANGLRRGTVVDIEEAVKSVSASVQEAKQNSNIPIESAYVSIGGNHISTKVARGLVAVSRADEEVSEEDVSRAINSASAISVSPNREIIYAIPRSFSLDDQVGIKNPVGMTGVRLEADVLIVEGAIPYIRNLTKCLHEAGIEIEGLVVDSLAASRSALTKRQKELGVLALDLGGGTVGMTVFEEGDIFHNCILPIGSSHITNDIAIGLRTGIDLAEKIKLEYGTSLISEINKRDTIDLSKLALDENGLVSRMEVAEIIEARIFEILDLVNRELKQIDRQGLLPAGVVLLGGGAKVPGLVDVVKEKLRLPAQIGFPLELDGMIEEVDDPAFTTAIGLVLWGIDMERGGSESSHILGEESGRLKKTFNWLKKKIKGFIP